MLQTGLVLPILSKIKEGLINEHIRECMNSDSIPHEAKHVFRKSKFGAFNPLTAWEIRMGSHWKCLEAAIARLDRFPAGNIT